MSGVRHAILTSTSTFSFGVMSIMHVSADASHRIQHVIIDHAGVPHASQIDYGLARVPHHFGKPK